MAGILSALGSTLNVLEVFSDSDGTAKGIVKALRGKKMRMIRADGSMLKFINKYIVEPVIIIDNSLRNLEELDKIIALHVDMFSGFYMQTFEVMTNVEGVSANTVIDTLATDNGGLTRALLSGTEMALESRDYAGEVLYGLDTINLSTEDESEKRKKKIREDIEKKKTDYDNSIKSTSSTLNRTNKSSRTKHLKNLKSHKDDNDAALNNYLSTLRALIDSDNKLVKDLQGKDYQHQLNILEEAEKTENSMLLKDYEMALRETHEKGLITDNERQQAITLAEELKELGKLEAMYGTKSEEYRKKMAHIKDMDAARKFGYDKNLEDVKHQHAIQRDRLNRTMEGNKAGLGRGAKELYVPEAIIRNIELTITTEITQGKNKGREIIMNIPITIKANILFTDIDNIVNAIEPSGDEFRFSYRWDEYRSGAISLTDFIFASDLIKKYKANKLKDKNSLMEIINARTLSANSKMIDNGFAGFEKYYNMVMIDSNNLPKIERQLRGKIHNHKYKERFLEYIQGLSVTIVDPDYERIYIGLKDVRGTTDVTFKTVVKTEKKGGADVTEIVKALMANKAPAF